MSAATPTPLGEQRLLVTPSASRAEVKIKKATALPQPDPRVRQTTRTRGISGRKNSSSGSGPIESGRSSSILLDNDYITGAWHHRLYRSLIFNCRDDEREEFIADLLVT